MRLSLHTDYGLRTLIFLESNRKRLVAIREIADAYQISGSHLAKVAQHLSKLGVVESVRGRGGGIRLSQAAEQIKVGWLIRELEGDTGLVECFDDERNSCPISPACVLSKSLREAQDAFFRTLDEYTLADITSNRGELVMIFEAN